MRGSYSIGDIARTNSNIEGMITSIKRFDEMDIVGIECAGKKLYFSHRQIVSTQAGKQEITEEEE